MDFLLSKHVTTSWDRPKEPSCPPFFSNCPKTDATKKKKKKKLISKDWSYYLACCLCLAWKAESRLKFLSALLPAHYKPSDLQKVLLPRRQVSQGKIGRESALGRGKLVGNTNLLWVSYSKKRRYPASIHGSSFTFVLTDRIIES